MRLDETARNWAWALAGIAIAACFLLATAELRQMGSNLAATNAEAQRAAKTVADYAELQAAVLRSEKNQKAIDAGLALGAALNGSVRLFNTQTLPRVNRELDALHETTLALQSTVWEFKAAIAVNSQRTSELLSESIGAAQELRGVAKGLNVLADKLQLSVPEIAGEFKALIASGRASTEQVNALLADPKLPALIAQAERLLRESGDVMTNLDAATGELPQIVRTARRWQTPINAARFLSILIGLF